jgi:hypothetical protein
MQAAGACPPTSFASRLARLGLLLLLALIAGCAAPPACANGPGDKPGECLPCPKSPPAIGPQGQ